MRNRVTIGAAALLLASATIAGAQDKTQQQAAAGSGGEVSFGGRFTSASGDEARYERYQDLRNGVNANILYNRETANWTFNLKATNIGYRDQGYVANFNSRRVKFSVLFDQTPLNYMYDAKTPYTCTAGNCALDAGLRSQIQAARGTRLNATTGAYTPVNTTPIGVPQALNQLTPDGTIYNSVARSFDMQSQRSTFAANAIFALTDNLNAIVGFNTFKRDGQMPWGASFAFPNAIEVPLVIDNRTTEFNAAMEWASHQGTMRMGYAYSKFDQAIPSFTWDNPLYATDYNVFNPVGGWYYDASGYSSSAGGAATGRMATAPTNTQNTFDWLGMIKLPGRTTANATFVMSAARQDAALIPWTTNSTINQQNVWAVFPELRHLPRESANMKVNYATGTFNVNSRPIKDVALTARYRYTNRSDVTRPFHAVEYVRFDAVPEETGGIAEPFQITRNTLDLNASFTPIPYSAVRVGYTMDRYDHWERAAEGWKDGIFRVSFDTVGNQWVTLRAVYEHSNRDSIDVDIADITGAGGQPALRFFDEASRNRDRGSFIVELNPMASVGVNFTLSTGKDDYAGADGTMEFGLLNNKNTGYAIGLNYAPTATLNLGADYGRETYNSLQESRNANPAPDAQWTDPNRNWTLNNDETVNYFSLYVNLVKAIAKTDIRFGYDYSDSDQAFLHGGPRVNPSVAGSLAAVGQFIPLPNVTNTWNRATFDLKYALNPTIGLGFAYYYEKFDVSDWATINTAGSQSLPVASLGTQTDEPRIDYLGGLFTGYGNRPYKGQTGYVRVYYMF
jgi:hypothetical protein